MRVRNHTILIMLNIIFVPALIITPTEAFAGCYQQDAILEELRFRYYRGPLADTEVCSHRLLGDLDNNCRVDFYDVALMAGNWLTDCLLNPSDPACVHE